jgi:3-phosphoshikimate 1-carboxyvinyltransferase
VLDGSDQLRRRPMRRITDPLRLMGAQIADQDGRAPLRITGSPLRGITYDMPVASAQVKSGLLLAGLFAEGVTTVIEPGPARDHTERMLIGMGADVQTEGSHVTITPPRSLRPLDAMLPGDISSAAFLIVAALLAAQNTITLEGVGVNPTRTGILDILALMGADIQPVNSRIEAGEPVADLVVRRSELRGAAIDGELIVRSIDEFPALMIAATQAHGATVVSQAAELRVKETDRIAVMAGELRKLGANIEERPDGFVIEGPQRLQGTVVEAHDDHRVAMSLAVAGLCASGETVIQGATCAEDSFPGFAETLHALGADVT